MLPTVESFACKMWLVWDGIFDNQLRKEAISQDLESVLQLTREFCLFVMV